MKTYLLAGLILAHLGQASASVLGDYARALPERAWVKLPANASLDGLDLPYSLLYWTDSGAWDPIRKQVVWIGAPGSCCGDGRYRMLTYAEATDTWSVSLAPFGNTGHGYDGTAVDPTTGNLYFALYMDPAVKKWDGQAWSALPPTPYDACPAMALAWFPGLNQGKGGLVHVGASGHLGWFDGTRWNAIAGGGWGEYNLFAEYNPVRKEVWLGGGNGAEKSNYRLTADLASLANLGLARLADAPLSLNVGASLKSTDPVSGKHLVSDLANGDFWEFAPSAGGGAWTKLSGLAGTVPDLGDGTPVLQVPLPEHGVILYFRHANARREIYLYRHAKPSASGLLRAPTAADRTADGMDRARRERFGLDGRHRNGLHTAGWRVAPR